MVKQHLGKKVNGKNKYMKPITARVKEKGGAVTYPCNQEVTMNADGSGGPISIAKFKKHNMFSKSGKVEVAETKKEHLALQKQGYGHESPAKKKDACYTKVKSRYTKWPSAYASGALVKCRKVGAANWGNKSK